jgi:hypothetical protein
VTRGLGTSPVQAASTGHGFEGPRRTDVQVCQRETRSVTPDLRWTEGRVIANKLVVASESFIEGFDDPGLVAQGLMTNYEHPRWGQPRQPHGDRILVRSGRAI